MRDYADQVRQFHQLQESAARTRLQAFHTRLSLAVTFCSLAETELDYCEVAQAEKLLRIVRQTVQFIRNHLNNPPYLSSEDKAGIRDQLTHIEKQVSSIDARRIVVDKSPYRN